MPEVIACPRCGKKLRLPGDDPPRRAKCPACGKVFGSDVDDLEPAEGTYAAPPPKAPRLERPERTCKLCGAKMRPEALICDLCGTHVEDEDAPDTREVRERRQRKQLQSMEDVKHRRLDMIAAQAGVALVALSCIGCGFLPVGAVVSVVFTVTMGFWTLAYRDGPPDDMAAALRRRYREEARAVALQFWISLAVSVVLTGATAYLFLR